MNILKFKQSNKIKCTHFEMHWSEIPSSTPYSLRILLQVNSKQATSDDLVSNTKCWLTAQSGNTPT